MTEIDDPEVLRREIRTMLEKVTDRGSLIFFQWMVRRVLANYPIPGDEELRALHQAFIRMHAAFRAKKRPTKEDMELVAKWTEGDAESMGRALGRAVKFFREKRGMSRLQLAKKARLPIRAILAIERGRVFDLSPVIDNLTMGLSVEAGELTDKLLDFEKDDKSANEKRRSCREVLRRGCRKFGNRGDEHEGWRPANEYEAALEASRTAPRP